MRLAPALLAAVLSAAAAPPASFDDPPSPAELRELLAAAPALPLPLPPPSAAPVKAPPPEPGKPFKARVVAALDADTLILARADGELELRLDAVDAPEIPHPEHGKLGQPYGEEAAAFVRGLTLGKTVTVTIKEADKYGRFVGRVVLPGGKDLQREVLRAGWAWWNFFFDKDETLNELENEAIAARRGLWAGKTLGGEAWPEAPWVFRRRVNAGLERLLPGAERTFAVKRAPDGDTLALGTRHSVYDYVRLAGIDAPEVSHSRADPGQPYGPESGARAAELLAAEGMTVTVLVEDTDPYGRIVGWVRLPKRGTTLNEVLLEDGLAWWYERYYPDLADYGRKQAKAKAARRGLWADPSPVPPWDYRRSRRKD